MVRFGQLNPDGTVTNARTIKSSSIGKCPFYILDPEHYREDESCRCDDPDHEIMDSWGYTWDKETGRWTA